MKNSYRLLSKKSLIRPAIVYTFATVLFPYYPIVGAQQADGEMGPAVTSSPAEIQSRRLKLDYSVNNISLRIELPPADVATKREAAKDDRPPTIGFHRNIPSEYQGNLSSYIDWLMLDNGSIVGALSVSSPEALAIRAAMRVRLTAGGEIRFFGASTIQEHAHQDRSPYTAAELQVEGDGPGIVWSPAIEGDMIGIEITLPSWETLSEFSFSIEKISHIYVAIGALPYASKQSKLAMCGAIDVQCDEGAPHYPEIKRMEAAVALFMIEKMDNRTSFCTGTLMNDKVKDTFVPYFLTARHCVSTDREAWNTAFYWFYQFRVCGSELLDSRYTSTDGGASLVATSVDQDSTLLRLRRKPPPGVYYSGWTVRRPHPGAEIFGIHHPSKDKKKYTTGHVISNNTDEEICPSNGGSCWTLRNSLEIDWDRDWGTTEPGSSGSGIFSGGHLHGVLAG